MYLNPLAVYNLPSPLGPISGLLLSEGTGQSVPCTLNSAGRAQDVRLGVKTAQGKGAAGGWYAWFWAQQRRRDSDLCLSHAN
jgi:hypothetical protein